MDTAATNAMPPGCPVQPQPASQNISATTPRLPAADQICAAEPVGFRVPASASNHTIEASPTRDAILAAGLDSATIHDTDGRLLWIEENMRGALVRNGLIEPSGLALATPDEEAKPAFDRFIKEGVEGKRFLLRTNGGKDWVIVRLQSGVLVDRPVRILRFTFSESQVNCARNGFAELFQLTRTEVAVLERYVRLCSPQDVAQEMGISRETVRSHLKRIHAKVGVGDGRELIRMVLAFEQI